MKPRLLDLFCGAGGAAMGYHRAGFNVVGVDINPQTDYPFKFIQADAMTYPLDGYDLVHASPPCQGYTALKAVHGNTHPLLIPELRLRLLAYNIPFIIENVAGAPITADLKLCGEMFGLQVIRHRYFEFHRIRVPQPTHPKHRGRVSGMRHGQWFQGPYLAVYGKGGGKGSVAQWQQAMGIDWTSSRKAIAEAIPPAYTQFVGQHLWMCRAATWES